MKRITLLVLTCLATFHSSHVFGQDTTKVMHHDEETVSDEDKDSPAMAKKKAAIHAAVGMEIGLGNSYLLSGGGFNDAIVGWRAGAFVYIPLVGKLCLQPGLFYATSGGGQTASEVTGSGGPIIVGGNNTGYTVNVTTTVWSIQSIELPINIGFRLGRPGKRVKNFIGIGPYVAYNIGGNYSYKESAAGSDENTRSLKIGTDASSDIRPFDYGLGLNLSTEWRSGLFLRARAQAGPANLSPQANSTLNSFGYGFQLGYLFGRKEMHKKKYHKDDEYIDRRM